MAEVGVGIDALRISLTGGASNIDPDASLGGVRSSTEMRALAYRINNPIPSIRINHAHAGIGAGTGSLRVQDGDLIFQAPDGVDGDPVSISEGEEKVIAGSSEDKALRIQRVAGLGFWGTSELVFSYPLNDLLAMGNIPSAERVSGESYYRGVILAGCVCGVDNIRIWFPPVAGTQVSMGVGTELAVSESIQTIADEKTAPSGVAFSYPTTEDTALVIPQVTLTKLVGVWFQKVFPAAGTYDIREDVQMALKFIGPGGN